ncbi:MAG: beta-ketoacyl synthase N-terminal-like domain-containing protein [Giesbergeria sp.]
MTPVYLAGSGLACALGLNTQASAVALSSDTHAVSFNSAPSDIGAPFPFRAIADVHGNWNERARALIGQVALEAGAYHARAGALFIATSSFDIGAVEQGAERMDYTSFADKVAAWLEWMGPVFVISTACTSSLTALLAAHALLRSGEEQEALVLGLEIKNQLSLDGFAALQLLSPSHSQPFGVDRDGLVLGEAVAALRLSTREPSLWKMLGGANVVDGRVPTSASVAAVVRMYQIALNQCGLAAQDIDLIKVQAAGSPVNDAVEAQGLREMFPVQPPLVSLKPSLGHTMGASGAAEIALLMACLAQNQWPPCSHAADEALGVRCTARPPDTVRRILASILGFGGGHATVVLERT